MFGSVTHETSTENTTCHRLQFSCHRLQFFLFFFSLLNLKIDISSNLSRIPKIHKIPNEIDRYHSNHSRNPLFEAMRHMPTKHPTNSTE